MACTDANAAPARAPRRRAAAGAAAGLVLALVVAAPVMAQSGDGYLLGAPQGSITLRGGFSQARAGSDVFADATQQFTLSRRDFGGFSGGAEAAVRVADNFDVSADVGYMRTSTPSHYRGFVDNAGNEIAQVTTLRRVPYTLNGKFYLTPPGRSVGRFAWIPSTVAPWVGAGFGVMSYRFSEEGDFVDFAANPQNPPVRRDAFVASGTTPVAQGLAGVDFTLTPRVALTGDARYLWAERPALGADFVNYQPLDLSGVSLSLGLTVRL